MGLLNVAVPESEPTREEMKNAQAALDQLTGMAANAVRTKEEFASEIASLEQQRSELAQPDAFADVYTPQRMVQLIVDNPEWSLAQLAKHFHRPANWMYLVLATDEFQAALQRRRNEIGNPHITATIEERFRAVALRSSEVLLEEIGKPKVDPTILSKAADVSVKALGLGNPKNVEQPREPGSSSTDRLAKKLLSMMDERERKQTVDVIDAELTNFEPKAADGD